jgi:hypothetical protein
MTVEKLMTMDKEQLPEAAMDLDSSELPRLVELLSEKNDTIRYQAFLTLQYRSRVISDVYPFWGTFRSKLKSDNSYQRSIGLMLLAENARWDSENRMDETLDDYLALLLDEKPITVRQCIQSLGEIARVKPDLHGKIAARLISLDLTEVRETMRKSVLLDILHVLAYIRKAHPTDELEFFILQALSGDILDKKSKKQIGAILHAAL